MIDKYDELVSFINSLQRQNGENQEISDAIRISRELRISYNNQNSWEIKAAIILRAADKVYHDQIKTFDGFNDYKKYSDTAEFYESQWRIDNLKHRIVTRDSIDINQLEKDIKIIKDYYNERKTT